MIGDTIDGRYRLLRVLGQGGMGAVYEAEHLGTGRRVAVKVILGPDVAADDTAVQRFQREARAAGSVDTPHVVQVLDTGTDPKLGIPYLVMELLQGEDLRILLKRSRVLPPEHALRVVGQACVGLLKAHEAGVIHRDIKPANLFLARRADGEIVVKVVDFGIAKIGLGAALTLTGDMLGSPPYMSPEQVMGDKTIDARTDVWSIGVVLYEALAGQRPHAQKETIGAMLMAVCSQPAPPIQSVAPWVPTPIAQLVHRALAIDLNERFPSMAAMLEALHALLPQGFTIHGDALVSLTPPPRAQVASEAPTLAGDASLTGIPANGGSLSTNGVSVRAAPSGKSSLAPALAVALALALAGGGLAIYNLSPRDAAPAPSGALAAPPPPDLPSSTPASPSSERTVRLAIEPASATVTIDDLELPVKDGVVEVKGTLGSTHRVRVRKDKTETVADVVIADSGAVPPRIQLEGALPKSPVKPAANAHPRAPLPSPSAKPAKPAAAGLARQFD